MDFLEEVATLSVRRDGCVVCRFLDGLDDDDLHGQITTAMENRNITNTAIMRALASRDLLNVSDNTIRRHRVNHLVGSGRD